MRRGDPARPPGGERAQDGRPDDPAWRADPLAPSPHSRLVLPHPAGDENPRPDGLDPGQAAELCAEVARNLLGDFAPALILLSHAERRRVQALLAYARALFDFARQASTEGERLAQINRLEFDVERALGGAPPEQPIFLRLAIEEKARPWPRSPLDRLAQAARKRATRFPLRTPEERERAAAELARAVLDSLLSPSGDLEPAPQAAARRAQRAENGVEPGEAALAGGGIGGELGGVLLRLRSLQHLAAERRAQRSPLPPSPGEPALAGEAEEERILAALRAECARCRRRLLDAPRRLAALDSRSAGELPAGLPGVAPGVVPRAVLHGYRRAAVYAVLAGQRLLRAIEERPRELLRAAPSLSLGARIALLLRARWLGR